MTSVAESFTDDQLRSAIRAGHDFWTALSDDDDPTLMELLTPAALGVMALGPLVPRTEIVVEELDPFRHPGPGIAARLRAFVGYSADDCHRMGLLSTATILGPGALRFSYTPVDEIRRYNEATLIEGRRIELELSEDRWLVEPIRRHDRAGVGVIDLAPLLGLES
jgi:hypothetical protein